MAPLARDQRTGTTRTLLREADGGLVRRSVLPGGLRVITEHVPGVRSVALGLWVDAGSRDETPAMAGSAHYLEHLLFKGTPTREALEISSALDEVGGELNAFTTKEYTCYYARVIDADLPVAVDVLTDMVTSSLLRTADVEAEREVILEEIAMHDDDPGDVVHDVFAGAMFGDTDLGRPVLGTVETITGVPRAAIHRFYRRRYTADHLVVAAAGNLRHADVVRLVRAAFRRAGALDGDALPAGPRQPRARRRGAGEVVLVPRDTEQANVVLGVPGITREDPRRYALGVLNAGLGGGMSSRLFQEVREKRGLAYSVYSFVSSFTDAGLFGVTAGCRPTRLEQVLEISREVVAGVAAHGLTDAEIARGKAQLRGGTVLGLEDTGSRMTRIAKSELHGDLRAVDDVLAGIEAVDGDAVRELAAELLGATPTLAVVGPYDDASAFAGDLA